MGAKVWEGGGHVLGGWGHLSLPRQCGVHPILLTTAWSHTALSSSHRMHFRGFQPTSWLSSLCQVQGPVLSPSDLSEAADSVNHFLSSLSFPLLAGFLTEKNPFCKMNIDHKGYVFPLFFFFFTSHFSISVDSTCCNYNTLQLNIGGRSWGQKAILIECMLTIDVFKIKVNHFIISYRYTIAQNSALPGGKSIDKRITCAHGIERSVQHSLWLLFPCWRNSSKSL